MSDPEHLYVFQIRPVFLPSHPQAGAARIAADSIAYAFGASEEAATAKLDAYLTAQHLGKLNTERIVRVDDPHSFGDDMHQLCIAKARRHGAAVELIGIPETPEAN